MGLSVGATHRPYKGGREIIVNGDASLKRGASRRLKVAVTQRYIRVILLGMILGIGSGVAVFAQSDPDLTPTVIPPIPTFDPKTAFIHVVSYVDYDDALNVRTGAGIQYRTVGTLARGRVVEITGEPRTVGSDTWVPIKAVIEYRGQSTAEGWVNRTFLAEQMVPVLFCKDANALTVVRKLIEAIKKQDSDLLAEVIHPTRGLYIGDAETKPLVHLGLNEVRTFFTSAHSYEWGYSYGGEAIKGTIGEVILPRLNDVFRSPRSTKACHTQQEDKLLVNFPITISWPVEQLNQNGAAWSAQQQDYYSLLPPGMPGHELEYLGWGVGIEYWDKQPYINALITFAWIP